MNEELQWYIEADKRGLLQGEDKAWFDEVKKRGLVEGAAAPSEPDEDVSVIGDVAKSGGIGLVQGALGLATLPGNIEALGRMGINYGAGLFGAEGDVVNSDTALTNYNDAKKLVEGYTGEFYKPKTTAGEYARTIGEMAPNVLGGGTGALAKTAQVLGPALLSETAGQITEGSDSEGVARVLGAVAGGIAGPRVAARTVTPVRSSPEAMATADALEALGVEGLTAGQRTGNRALRVAEQVTDYVPFSGRRNADMAERASRTYTQAAKREAGLPQVGDEVLDQATTGRIAGELGREYDNLRIATDVPYEPQFLSRLQRQAADYYDNVETGKSVNTIRSVVDDLTQRANASIATGAPMLTGRYYQTLRSRLAKQARDSTDPTTQNALRNILNTLDNQAVRSLPAAEQAGARAYMRDLNQRYRGFKTLEDAVANAPSGERSRGLVSPISLAKASKKGNAADYTRGRTALSRLAAQGEQVLEKLPDSGTAQRSALMKTMSGENATKIGTGLALGGSGLGMVDAVTGGATIASGAALSRLLMSPLMQRYLSNRVYPQGMPRLAPGQLGQEWTALTNLPALPREIRALTLPQTAVSNAGVLTGSQQGLTAEQLEEEEKGAFRR